MVENARACCSYVAQVVMPPAQVDAVLLALQQAARNIVPSALSCAVIHSTHLVFCHLMYVFVFWLAFLFVNIDLILFCLYLCCVLQSVVVPQYVHDAAVTVRNMSELVLTLLSDASIECACTPLFSQCNFSLSRLSLLYTYALCLSLSILSLSFVCVCVCL